MALDEISLLLICNVVLLLVITGTVAVFLSLQGRRTALFRFIGLDNMGSAVLILVIEPCWRSAQAPIAPK